MANFDFIDSTSNLTFDFWLTGDNSDFDFTEVSDSSSTYNFEFDEVVSIFTIFKGTSNFFNAIWADPKASLNSGKFYAGRQNDLSIINNNNRQVTLEDYYSKTSRGRSEDSLNSEDIIDINVTY